MLQISLNTGHEKDVDGPAGFNKLDLSILVFLTHA